MMGVSPKVAWVAVKLGVDPEAIDISTVLIDWQQDGSGELRATVRTDHGPVEIRCHLEDHEYPGFGE